MPKTIKGKKLTAKEHRQWKHVYKSQRKRGMSRSRAGASATSQVKKSMRKR